MEFIYLALSMGKYMVCKTSLRVVYIMYILKSSKPFYFFPIFDLKKALLSTRNVSFSLEIRQHSLFYTSNFGLGAKKELTYFKIVSFIPVQLSCRIYHLLLLFPRPPLFRPHPRPRPRFSVKLPAFSLNFPPGGEYNSLAAFFGCVAPLASYVIGVNLFCLQQNNNA